MPKYKVIGKKEAKFFTYVEAENATVAITDLDAKNLTWLPEEENTLTDGSDLMIGQPEEVK